MRIYTTWHRWSITIDVSVLFLLLFMYKPVNCDLSALKFRNNYNITLANVPSVSYLNICLINDGVMQRSVDFGMPQKLLHLFDWHTFFDSHSRHGTAELVWMHMSDIGAFAKFI